MKSMRKKGQAGMEFLMTYGWAFLVLVAILGALAYFGILSPGRVLPETCQGPAGLDCVGMPAADRSPEAGYFDGGVVVLPLANNLGEDIWISSVRINGSCDSGSRTGGQVDSGNGWERPDTLDKGVKIRPSKQFSAAGSCKELGDFDATERIGVTVLVKYSTVDDFQKQVSYDVIAEVKDIGLTGFS